MSWDESFADRYEEWSAPMTADIDFYVGLARAAEGPLVELAIGNGRVAIPVALATGKPVIGVDTSPVMLAKARAAAAAAGVRLDLREGDMCDLTLDEPTGLIYCPYRALLHLHTWADRRRTFERVAASLRPDGDELRLLRLREVVIQATDSLARRMDQVGEAELLAAATAGQVLVCGDGAARRSVAADLLRRCCRELRDQIDPRGLRLCRAMVTGSLDLAGLDVPFPLRFEGCSFTGPVTVAGAQLVELALTDCDDVPGLLANGVRIRRDLDLSRSRVAGALGTSASTSKLSAIWLCESEIGGRLLCVDTLIQGGDRSIQADRLHVTGNVRLLHGFTAHGEVRLIGARIGGSLDLTGASIESPATGLALDLGEAVIEASVFLIDAPSGRRPLIRGRIDMGQARIGGQFLVRNATLEARAGAPVGSAYSRSRVGGTALSAPRLSVGAELTFDGTCQVTGGIDLSMSQLGSVSVRPGCSLQAPGRTALDLTNTELLSTFTVGERVPVQGTIRLSGARIHGNLCLRSAVLSAPEGRSLVAAQGVTVDGEAELQDLMATGGDVGFRAATIGSFVDAAGAKLHNPGGYTLNLVQANVKGSVRLVDGFSSTGEVVLNRAAIEGRLICTDGTFHYPGPHRPGEETDAIEAISATIRSGMDLGWKSISPRVDFTNTRTSFLADDPGTWPSRYVIVGFVYDRFEQPQGATRWPWDHAARAAWLSRQAIYDAGPYEQAARVFREHGYTAGAEAILIAQRRHARRVITGPGAPLRRALDIAYSTTVGYGFRPRRVLWLLAVLLALVIISLEIPTAQATMRATTAAGRVYSTHGPAQKFNTGTGPGRAGAILPAARSDACGGGEVRCFNPVLYAIDTVVPLVSLDQRSTWYPDPSLRDGAFMQWWLNAATLLGWLLSSIFVLSLARLSRAT